MAEYIHCIAACGLFCCECRKFRSGKCPGCKGKESVTWCKIRKCSTTRGFNTCAECDLDVTACKTHDNLVGRLFALVFNSDRAACIHYIQRNGEELYALKMKRDHRMSMPRRKPRRRPD